MRLKAEGWFTRYDVAGHELIERTQVDAYRLRLALEGSNAWDVGAGTLTPALELGVRNDGGDGMTGGGVEVGGGLRYAAPALGLMTEASGRMLLAHEGDYREWGVSGALRVSPGLGGRGLSLSVAPAWGDPQSGTERLWRQGATGLPAEAAGSERPPRVEATLGYGVPALGGVVTPYSGLTLDGAGAQNYRLGGRFEVGPSFSVTLEGERRQTAAEAPDDTVTLRGQVNF